MPTLRFSKHAIERMISRNATDREVIATVTAPLSTRAGYNDSTNYFKFGEGYLVRVTVTNTDHTILSVWKELL